ncbi:hypothetical protein PMZ80_011165 [Knufia obscura]|uniref:Uncharacterized protein n=2 Tax=Trichomeriaceae TaxID=1233474 RepID=A0ABR0K0K0_9EURO|nr:hypothetical protein LTR24_008221 [Lithohypha guttulata]KAK5097840.1 hypothetical protein LTS08_006595 [Lithohypha guttulata]KAK5313837.1 hypothetical protein LTR70_007411 [Exophiala xenobiotica]KAK5936600.1 hypothetical protein PMZ80_011165 [Knufia obscura]
MPGVIQFLNGQFSTPPTPNVDLAGRTILVTGANSGLGLDAAKLLLRLNCSTIVLACRSIAKGERAKQEILSTSRLDNDKPTIVVFELDLCSFISVAAFADRCQNLPRLDAAILNAGVDLTEFSLTEGYETTITVNVISTFFLATLLVPVLRLSAQKYKITPHIAVVGSAVHFWADPKELTTPPTGEILSSISDPEKTNMKSRYNLSKLPVMLLVRHLSSLLSASAQADPITKSLVVINNVAPGLCVTNLFREQTRLADAPLRVALKVMGRSSEEGARTLVHGATAGRETGGAYLSECVVKNASEFVRSEEGAVTANRIWEELRSIYEVLRPGCTAVL